MSNQGRGTVDTAVIEVAGLHKSYRRGSNVTPVLQDLSFQVKRGECVFLAGPSGSGKSTLLSVVGCILAADKGTVRILGQDVSSLSRKKLAALRLRNIGFVFQRFHLIRGLTAVENVCVPLRLNNINKHDAHQRAMDLLDTLGLAGKASSHPSNMSTGQCQRIALARALANDPQLILADEPTASLDIENGTQVMKLLRKLASNENRSVVVVTHDSRIFSYADQIYLLENGEFRRSNDVGENNSSSDVILGTTGPFYTTSQSLPSN